MKPINELTLLLPSRSANERVARMCVAAFAAQLDPTLEELGDIRTVVSEAVTNCIVHAYPKEIGEIRIRCRIFEGGLLELVISDRGVGIPDIAKAREPMFTTGGEERSGMGFTIMESFSDSCTVRNRAGGGVTVKLTRRISPRLG